MGSEDGSRGRKGPTAEWKQVQRGGWEVEGKLGQWVVSSGRCIFFNQEMMNRKDTGK